MEEIKNCCRCLDSDKITKRRQAFDLLKNLLNNNAIIASLTSSSKQSQSTFNWDQVFYSAKSFFLKESEKLEKDERLKENPSVATRNSWADLKRKSASLPKLVIKKASLGNWPISIHQLLDFVFLILDRSHPYLLENHAGVALQVLQNHVMTSPQYYLSITQDKWKDLLRICIWIYEKDVARADQITVLSVIESIFKYFKLSGTGTAQRMSPSVSLRAFPPFFIKATSSSPAYGVQKALLSLIFTVCTEFGSQWRYALCKIGEDTMSFFLQMWEDSETPRQILLIRYFNIQLMMHYPQEDGVFQERSKHCNNEAIWEKWMKQIYLKIYDFLMKHCDNVRLGAKSSSSEGFSVSNFFLDLAARLLSKIFDEYGDVGRFDVTQLHGTSSSNLSCSSYSRPNKKRRLEIGFQPLCEMLSQEGSDCGMIPWYQILSRMLTNYAGSFTQEKAQALLNLLLQLLGQIKNPLILEQIILCLMPLSLRFAALYPKKIPQSLKVQWSSVWDIVVRLVGGRQCVTVGQQLLQRLLEYKCVNIDGKLYTMFIRGIIPADLNGLQLLETLLKVYPIPKEIKGDVEYAIGGKGASGCECLIHALLSLEDDNGLACSVNSINHPKALSDVLILLRLDDTTKKSYLLKNGDIKKLISKTSSSISLEVEEIFLKSTFSMSPKSFNEELCLEPRMKVNPQLENEIVKRVSSFVQQKLSVGSDIQNEDLELALNIIEMVLYLTFAIDDSRMTSLFSKSSLILKGFEKIMAEGDASRYSNLLSPLKHLLRIYKTAIKLTKSNPTKQEIGKKLLSEFPSELSELASNLIQSKFSDSTSSSQSNVSVTQLNISSRNLTAINDTTDDFDPDFDDEDPGMEVSNDFDDMDENTSEAEKGVQLCFYKQSFTEKDACVLSAIHYLGSIYELNLLLDQEEDEKKSLFVNAAYDFMDFSEKCDINDCTMVFEFVKFIFSMTYHELNISDGIIMLSKIAQRHSKDSRAAYCILQAIEILLTTNGPRLVESHRSNILHIVKVFAKKYSEGLYGENVARAIFEVNLRFTELDPLRCWSSYEVESDSRSSEFYFLLRNPLHELRMLAAEHLGLLFSTKEGCMLPLMHQNDKFQHVYQIAIESLNVEAGMTFGEFLVDEGNCRVTSFLSALSYVALCSPYLESKALFAFFSAPKIHRVDTELVKSAVQRISNERGLTLSAYLDQHLSFVFPQWIRDDHSFEDFAYTLVQCESKVNFLESFTDQILIALFQEDKLEGISSLAQQLEIDICELIKRNLSDLLSLIIPYAVVAKINSEEHKNVPKIKLNSATKKLKFLQVKIGDGTLSTHLSENLGKIVLKMLGGNHDETCWGDEKIIVPPTQLYFEAPLLVYAFENMHKVFSIKSNDTLIKIMARGKVALPVVLHGLLSDLDGSSCQHHFRWSISKLDTFLTVLMPYIGNGLEKMNVFIIRKLVHILSSYVLKIYQVDKMVAKKCVSLLEKFVLEALRSCPRQLESSLPLLLHRLLGFLQKSELSDRSSRILIKIFSSDSSEIQVALSTFPLVPSDDKIKCMSELNQLHMHILTKLGKDTSLCQEISNFVEIPISTLTSYHFKHIYNLLKEKANELPELLERTDSTGTKLIHLLIYKIVSVISLSEDEQMHSLGLKCLGELGPVDLDTQVFAIEEDHFKEHHRDSDKGTVPYIHVLQLLNKLTLSPDVKTVEVASDTLGLVLGGTKPGQQMYKIMPESFRTEVYSFTSQNKPSSTFKYQSLDEESFARAICREEIWGGADQFNDWIKMLTQILIKCGCNCDFMHNLDEMCNISSSFCLEIFPYIVHFVLVVDPKGRRGALSQMFNYCINKNLQDLDHPSSTAYEESNRVHDSKLSIQLILKVVNYLRLQSPRISFSGKKKITHWERVLWLDLEYLQLAKAAFICGQYFSALLFVEIACELIHEPQNVFVAKSTDEQSKNFSQRRQWRSPLQRISNTEKGREACEIMFKIYNALEHSDGVEGCSYSGRTSSFNTQSILSQHRGNWLNSISISDAEQSSADLVSGLKKMGMFDLTSSVIKTMPEAADEWLLETQAECAWRLGKWEETGKFAMNTSASSSKNEFGFNSTFLQSLISFKEKDFSGIEDTLSDARRGILKIINENSNESCNTIYPLLARLKIISDLSHLTSSVIFENNNYGDFELLSNIESIWEKGDSILLSTNEYVEVVLSARIASTKILSSLTKNKYLDSVLFKMLIKKCQLSRCLPSPSVSHCTAALLDIKKLELSFEESCQFKVEQALLFKSLKNDHQAINILKELVTDVEAQSLSDKKQLQEFCRASLLCGQLLMDSRSMSPKSIMEDYLVKSVQHLEKNFDEKMCPILPESYQQLAFFSDKLYKEIREFRDSDQYRTKLEQIKKSEQEAIETDKILIRSQQEGLETLKSLKKNKQAESQAQKNIDEEKRELTKKKVLLTKEIQKEESYLTQYKLEEEYYLKLALINYLKCLKTSSQHSMMIFRVVALWFENLTKKFTNDCIRKFGSQLKSHQFIPLLYQLVARLTLQEKSPKHHESFPSTLVFILERICKDHPHHALPAVLMLANSYIDQEFNNSLPQPNKKKSQKVSSNYIEEDRVQTAKNLISRLKSTPLCHHLAELERICEAYVELAYVTVPKHLQQDNFSNKRLAKLKNFKYAAPLANPIPIQPSASYSPPLIVRWEDKFFTPGGINCPKRLTLHTSDGRKSLELLKGNDDLRQDAVLQQVFSVVNDLLKSDSGAKMKKLSLRTYMVTPISQKCGIIQWCTNTCPLKDYIEGTHSRYYPEQMSHRSSYQKMQVLGKNASPDIRFRTLEEILQCHSPILRFFFLENFPRPEQWFIRKQMYTNSLAASSIVGFIFGIGDRHCSNILIDNTTAELIHIDLGIAFELGHLLPTPETVPFRLTQNIVDALGPTGIEGSLRKSMETTLTVLREAKSVIITIVDVLRHDPLHQWTLRPDQVAKLQETDSHFSLDTSRSMAERALLRVQQKLNGLQDGLVLSVNEHVSLLLQQATDLNNLSRLYVGWSAWI